MNRKLIKDVLNSLEWSGRSQGPGTSMGASNGSWYKSCPMCRGLEKPNGNFIRSAVGHKDGCKLQAAIAEMGSK